MKFNINDYVRVKLTDHGRKILDDQHTEFKKVMPSAEPIHKPDEDGWCKFQLWELMSIFGQHLYNGCQIPFETTIELNGEE
jgi:hypothetical protein